MWRTARIAPVTFVLAGILGTGCSTDAAWIRDAIASEAHLIGQRNAPHRVALLDGGRDALLFRLKLIREAKFSVYIQTFIWSNDEVGRLVMHELLEAARRGVQVRIVADTMWSSGDVLALARIAVAHPLLEVKAYNPPTSNVNPGFFSSLAATVTRFKRLNQRMHNKVFIVDERLAICGGRNYADEYYDEDPELSFRDRDIVLDGPVVADVVASWDGYWDAPLSVPLRQMTDVAETIAKTPPLTLRWRTLLQLRISDLLARCDRWLGAGQPHLRWYDVNRIAFWGDPPGKPDSEVNPLGVARRLAALAGRATERLWLQTPYCVLSGRAEALCRLLKRNGVRVEVSTNSLAATDNWLAYAHTIRQRRMAIRELELHIHEMKAFPGDRRHYIVEYDALRERARGEPVRGPPVEGDPKICLHAKSLVVDARVALVGSYNLDPRSGNWNSEVVVAVWDEPFARHLRGMIQRDVHPGNSWTVAPRRRVLPLQVIATLLEEINSLVRALTTFDIWPLRHCSLYELKAGCEPCGRDDPQFYERYEPVGEFPGVDSMKKVLLTKLARMLTGWLQPLL